MRKKVVNHLSWVGYVDWELQKFHGDEYSVEHGSSQNAYLLEEEKTILFDTVWAPHKDWFVENLKTENDLHKIDAIVMDHGEQDHSGSLPLLMKEIPDVPIYCTANAVRSLEGQYGKKGWNFHVVKTGDTLDVGHGKKLIFIEMPMLHWPDSMATYITGDNTLISMDAFGQHYACEELFNDLADPEKLWYEAEKYFVNILGPFRALIRPKLKAIQAMNLPIDIICPSHGVVWRDNPMQIIEAYQKWADPSYCLDQITIVYDTMWDGTKKLAHAIGKEINRQSPKTRVAVCNVSKMDKNDIMVEVFRSKAIAVGSPTCINDVLTSVAGWLSFLKTLKFSHKRAAAFGCYGWSGESTSIIEKRLREAGFEVVDASVLSNWNPDEDDYAKIPDLVAKLLAAAPAPAEKADALPYRKYVCSICGWTYDEALGCPEQNIAPGTRWQDLPDSFHCQICHMHKDKFNPL